MIVTQYRKYKFFLAAVFFMFSIMSLTAEGKKVYTIHTLNLEVVNNCGRNVYILKQKKDGGYEIPIPKSEKGEVKPTEVIKSSYGFVNRNPDVCVMDSDSRPKEISKCPFRGVSLKVSSKVKCIPEKNVKVQCYCKVE